MNMKALLNNLVSPIILSPLSQDLALFDYQCGTGAGKRLACALEVNMTLLNRKDVDIACLGDPDKLSGNLERG